MGSPVEPPLILASRSPQRRAILEQLRIPFEVVEPDFEEVDGTGPLERAVGKARSVDCVDERPVLGVDTEVLLDGELLGKPQDATDAERMLERLAGRTHEVVAGLCLRTPAWEAQATEVTRVSFRPLTPRDLAQYVASGEWEGRAGGYAIQGLGAVFVEHLAGSYSGVMGLPLYETATLLRTFGVIVP